jgi:hypothetical protein
MDSDLSLSSGPVAPSAERTTSREPPKAFFDRVVCSIELDCQLYSINVTDTNRSSLTGLPSL